MKTRTLHMGYHVVGCLELIARSSPKAQRDLAEFKEFLEEKRLLGVVVNTCCPNPVEKRPGEFTCGCLEEEGATT